MYNISKRVRVASITVSIAAVFIMSAFSFAVNVDDAYADTTITVTDSTGRTLIMDAPADKVATIGYGFTKTVVDLGAQEKIVAYDSYSVALVKELGLEGVSVGSSYSSNKDHIYSTMVQLKESGRFNIDTDLVIINDYSGTVTTGGTREMLENDGFKVLCFGAYTYNGVLDIVENIAIAIGKESAEALNNMHEALNLAEGRASEIDDDNKVRAMYINDYQGKIRVYNEGIAVSMIELAGGKNVGFNPKISNNFYPAEVSLILQLNPDVIFLDGNYPMSEKEFQKNVLRTASIVVIKMETDWNNYCPSAAEGLTVVSDAMIEEYDHSESVMDILYIHGEMVLATGMIFIVVLAGLFVMRRS